MLRLCYEHDVRPSVCLSVTLVDCDHSHSATKSVNGLLGYLYAKAAGPGS